MATDPLFGWNLTFKTVEKDVCRKSDIIIAFIHFNLVKRGFRSIGIGDERTLSGDEETSELLPTGWNDKENYTLRYVVNDKLYILHGLITDGNLIVNLMRSEDLVVSNVVMKVEDTIKEMKGQIAVMMPNYQDIMFNINRDLIDVITDRTLSTIGTQTSRVDVIGRLASDERARTVMRAQQMVNQGNAIHDPWILQVDFSPPPGQQFVRGYPPGLYGVGRSDLDPHAPPGAGMIFQPLAPRRDVENPGIGIPGGLPRGAVPPGARFDPFGPPGAGPLPGPVAARRPPDADHLPPPGFDASMFM